jgi:hypothetical protein
MEFGIVRLIGIFVVGKFMLNHIVVHIVEGFGTKKVQYTFALWKGCVVENVSIIMTSIM